MLFVPKLSGAPTRPTPNPTSSGRYYLAKMCQPLSHIKFMCELVELHGVHLGKTYINHVMARDMMMSIAAVLRRRIETAAQASPALGLMVDESTDVSKTGSMVLYLRLMVKGRFETQFWKLVQVGGM